MQQAESYKSVETRIQAAIEVLRKRDVVNIAATAREFNLPEQRLRARWNGRLAKSDLPGPNKRLTEAQELAVCMYLDRLDAIGAQARMKMVTSFVGEHWTQRFLDRHPEYYVVKANTMDIDRKLAHDPPPTPPTTPPPPDAPEVPLTIRSLKRQFHSVYNEVCHLEGMTPSLKRRLKTALNGGLVQAHAGAEAAAEIKATQEAEAQANQAHEKHWSVRAGLTNAETVLEHRRRRFAARLAATPANNPAGNRLRNAAIKPACKDQQTMVKSASALLRFVSRNAFGENEPEPEPQPTTLMSKLANTIPRRPAIFEPTRPTLRHPTGRVLIDEDEAPAALVAVFHECPTENHLAVYSDGSRLEDGHCGFGAVARTSATMQDWCRTSGYVGDNKEAYDAELFGIAAGLEMASRSAHVRSRLRQQTPPEHAWHRGNGYYRTFARPKPICDNSDGSPNIVIT
ncbi:hypothetical protein FN846DRAFT_905340 [Sphaerosporella brunnea]|uniref:RNase H type-1 domain-containing protein n=1 Tax=Sphaerosporella brunnea TaxID=1250544 RepID=A0A5J5F269_9PEZI|nr:hypothetical protein FN846DRAFT_905340 [Sphaerosporella brunnea]